MSRETKSNKPRRAKLNGGDQSYTPDTFAAAESISRAMLYKLWRQGKGPSFYLIGNRRRITEQARREWQAASMT
jgi:hypothetical protein